MMEDKGEQKLKHGSVPIPQAPLPHSVWSQSMSFCSQIVLFPGLQVNEEQSFIQNESQGEYVT